MNYYRIWYYSLRIGQKVHHNISIACYTLVNYFKYFSLKHFFNKHIVPHLLYMNYHIILIIQNRDHNLPTLGVINVKKKDNSCSYLNGTKILLIKVANDNHCLDLNPTNAKIIIVLKKKYIYIYLYLIYLLHCYIIL